MAQWPSADHGRRTPWRSEELRGVETLQRPGTCTRDCWRARTDGGYNATARRTRACPGTQCSLALELTRANTMRPNRLAASFDVGLDCVIDRHKGLHVRQGAGPNEDLPTTCQRLQALGDVYHIADDRIFHTLLGANVTDDGFATVDANTDMECRLTKTLARRVETGSSTLHIQGRLHGPLWMIRLHEGGPKEGEDTIPEEFVECALVCEEDMDHHVKIGVQDIDDLLRGMLLRKGREVADIGEQHGHVAAPTAQRAQVRIRKHLLHHVLTQETTQSVPEDLGFRDVVNQHQHATIFAPLIIKDFPMDRAVMFAPTHCAQTMFAQCNTAVAFDLLGEFTEGQARPTSKNFFHGFADHRSGREAT